jgi:hypothetical protein
MPSRASCQSLVEALLTEHKVTPRDMHEEMRPERRERVAVKRNRQVINCVVRDVVDDRQPRRQPSGHKTHQGASYGLLEAS